MTSAKLTLDDWLDDLSVRFLINLPVEELSSMERILFNIEEAQWFYEDFIRPLDPNLPQMSMKQLSKAMFDHCHLFATAESAGFDFEDAYATWLTYKKDVPVRGAIMLNHDMTHVVLVKGWKSSAKWSFPRGKINQSEDDLICAIREAAEETGFDLDKAGLVLSRDEMENNNIHFAMRGFDVKLYIFRGVPMDTQFAPRTRQEISRIEWYKLTDLPTNRNRNPNFVARNGQELLVKDNKFFMVAPFVKSLKVWIKKQHKLDRQRGLAAGKIAPPVPAGITDTEDVDAGDTMTDHASQEARQAPVHIENRLAQRASDSFPEVSNVLPQQGIQSQDLGAELMRVLGVAGQQPQPQHPHQGPQNPQSPAVFHADQRPPPPLPHPTPGERLMALPPPQPESPHPHHGPVLHHFPPQHGPHSHPPPFNAYQHQAHPFPRPQQAHMHPRETTGQSTPLQTSIPPHLLPRPTSKPPAFSSHAPHIPRHHANVPDQTQLFPKIHGPAITPTPKLPPAKLTPHALGLLNAFKGQAAPSANTSQTSFLSQMQQWQSGQVGQSNEPPAQGLQPQEQRVGHTRDTIQQDLRGYQQGVFPPPPPQQNVSGTGQYSISSMQNVRGTPPIPQSQQAHQQRLLESFGAPQRFSNANAAAVEEAFPRAPQTQTSHQQLPHAQEPQPSHQRPADPSFAVHALHTIEPIGAGPPHNESSQFPNPSSAHPMQQPKPRSAHQDSLLTLFGKSGGVPSLSSATTLPSGLAATLSRTNKKSEVAELSAHPTTPGLRGMQLFTGQAGQVQPMPHEATSAVEEVANGYGREQPAASKADAEVEATSESTGKDKGRGPGLTSATVTGPVNAPDFATVKKHSHPHAHPVHSQSRGGSQGISPTQATQTHIQAQTAKRFSPKQILKRENAPVTASPVPQSPAHLEEKKKKKPVGERERPVPRKMSTAPLQTRPATKQNKSLPFQPVILKRPQPGAATGPAARPERPSGEEAAGLERPGVGVVPVVTSPVLPMPGASVTSPSSAQPTQILQRPGVGPRSATPVAADVATEGEVAAGPKDSVADVVAQMAAKAASQRDAKPLSNDEKSVKTSGTGMAGAGGTCGVGLDGRGSQTAGQKSALLSLFGKRPSDASAQRQTTQTAQPSFPPEPMPVPASTSPSRPAFGFSLENLLPSYGDRGRSPIPPNTLPHPPSLGSMQTGPGDGIMSPVSPLPDKSSLVNSPNHMSRSRISSIGESSPAITTAKTGAGVQVPGSILGGSERGKGQGEQRDQREQQAGMNGHGGLGLGVEDAYSGLSGKGEDAEGISLQSLAAGPKSPVDKDFLLGFLKNFAGKGADAGNGGMGG